MEVLPGENSKEAAVAVEMQGKNMFYTTDTVNVKGKERAREQHQYMSHSCIEGAVCSKQPTEDVMVETHGKNANTQVYQVNIESGRAQHRAGYAWQASIQEHHTGSGASNSIISRLSRGLSKCTVSTQQLQNSKTAKCNSTARVSGFQPCYSKYTQLSTLSWSMIQYSLWSMYGYKGVPFLN